MAESTLKIDLHDEGDRMALQSWWQSDSADGALVRVTTIAVIAPANAPPGWMPSGFPPVKPGLKRKLVTALIDRRANLYRLTTFDREPVCTNW